jgi:DNA-directed RNA polymerase subunit RPC12/RpoP
MKNVQQALDHQTGFNCPVCSKGMKEQEENKYICHHCKTQLEQLSIFDKGVVEDGKENKGVKVY